MATLVAMLCVLREDLLLEVQGIRGDDFGALDDNDEVFRRTYFWRNSLCTLEEIKARLNRLYNQRQFGEALAKEPQAVQDSLARLRRELNAASKHFLLELRNTLGGHLDETMMQETLDTMDFASEGFIEVGEAHTSMHYKFATTLILAALLRDVDSDKEADAKLQKLLGDTASFTRAIASIDEVFVCYMRDRRLP